MKLAPGQKLSHYEIQELVGAGGMGEVFRARDTTLGRDVALKFLPPELGRNREAKQRFLNEARAASAMEHPNVCTIHAFEETEDGELFIAMALYEGETLGERLRQGKVETQQALEFARQIADGLAAAHDHGILHRDIKPANIEITAEGRAVILDFGLAKARDVDLTQPGTTMGTLAYMSPEQARGEAVDARTDVWSLGVVLYEMLAGERPFQGENLAVLRPILEDEPAALPPEACEHGGAEVARVVKRCLTKDRAKRMPSAAALAEQLGALLAPPETGRRGLVVGLALAGTLLVAAIASVTWGLRSAGARERETWARAEAIPAIEALLEQARWDISAKPGWEAYRLAREVEEVLGDDPALAALWPRITFKLQITSEPPGALVRAKAYGDEEGQWFEFGRTPLVDEPVPWGLSVVELDLDGRRSARDILWGVPYFSDQRRFVLDPIDRGGSGGDDMVRVAVEPYPVQLPGLDQLAAEPMTDFLIDRTEVTNAEFQRFVDAGGYTDPGFWKVPFHRGGRELSFEQAVALFTDSTGRPGPAGWEVENHPEGRGDWPVGGISWYEAVAYCEFAGVELPTIFHWSMVAFTFGSSEIIPRSNFGEGPEPVGSPGSRGGENRYGAVDMAGNVREWCANQVGGTEKHFILGGGWNDLPYSFNDAYGADSFDRSPTNGLRCIRLTEHEPNREQLWRPIDFPFRDFSTEEPVDDETFALYLRQYDYDHTPLNARVEGEEEQEEGIRQVVSFDAAYGDERVRALLFLPKDRDPPFQTVVFFPGSNAIHTSSSDGIAAHSFRGLLASGRALILPIYKGTYERGTELDSDYQAETNLYKDHVIAWGKDLSRTIDYLETRDDIDTQRLVYYGVSWGGALGGIMPAIETRFRCNVLYVAGMQFQRALPEVDQINYVTHVKQPTLMINGEFDFFFPVETAQKPMFELLGTPPEDKRHVVYNGAHSVPRRKLLMETLAWLDRYLGAVE